MYLNALTRHSSTVCKSLVSVTERNLVLEKPSINRKTLNFMVSPSWVLNFIDSFQST